MEITCPKCLKKFETNQDLIPQEGRLVQCGSCENKWFFKKDTEAKKEIASIKKEGNELKKFEIKKKEEKTKKKIKINQDIIENSDPYIETKKNKINFFKPI